MNIIFIHNLNKITTLYKDGSKDLTFDASLSIQSQMATYANLHSEACLIWVHESLADIVDYEWVRVHVKDSKMFFFNPTSVEFLSPKIGYIEPSPFLNINKNVSYATWQASAFVGCVMGSDFLKFGTPFLKKDYSFGYFLTIVSKIGHRNGFLTYSTSKLLNKIPLEVKPLLGNSSEMFRLTAQYYGFSKSLQLFLLLFWYDYQFPLIAFFKSLFVQRISFDAPVKNLMEFDSVAVSEPVVVKELSLDVLIPTIGRKPYLYDVLCDLKNQTKIPSRVIIVEQNADVESISELDYLKNELWPFEIIHHFTHQTGACNARNIGLKEVISDWVFFADDDIRISEGFIGSSLKAILTSGESAFTLACFRVDEKPVFNHLMHWDTFGSGCSIVKKEALAGLTFDMRFENGFGEDADFGMQLRNNGCDVLYLPKPIILHLKAPVGGFRVQPTYLWENEKIKPKPAPTIMLFKLLYHTKQQLLGYKMNLFLKFYSHQTIRNPFLYFKVMKNQWNESFKWANILRERSIK
ncbi:glycosyltransferase family A protein [Flavobacterium gelidilacus]|uniref:glycosyltransferase family 2 protein n=1 Tax=Flavobacterium gelidilacus TaxID=206041 RepID=UPI00054D378C|nr:glycosyltransferase family A protein [Flavobacterium gelidilacus]